MKRQIEHLFRRILNSLLLRAMPIALENYYSMYSPRWHPHYLLRQQALEESVEYIKQAMPHAMIKTNQFEVLRHGWHAVSLEGLFLEFGVRTGTTINYVAKHHPKQTVHGFDSFEGLPEAWTGWVQTKGTFGGEGLPVVRDNVELVIGWFDETLPTFTAQHPEPVAFIHIDSDLYSSAKTILDALAPQLQPGSIIVFNEYFNYPNWQQHEYRAWQEFCEEHRVRYEYLCWGQFEVAIRLTGIETKEVTPRETAQAHPTV